MPKGKIAVRTSLQPANPENLNELAAEITRAEGGKVSISVAQVSEVLRLALDRLAQMPLESVAALLASRSKRRKP